MVPELETGRLRLRNWREEDTDPYHAFFCDPVTRQVYGTDFTRSEIWRRIAAFIGHWQLRGFGHWALEDKATHRFAGYAGLWFPPEFGDIEVGYGIMPEFRGRGYAPEAAGAARDFGYSQRAIPRLVSYINPVNHASIRVAEKLGAIPDGEYPVQGKPHIVFLHTNPFELKTGD
jgi:RimJ/RimL family protein N-acetyltransferase